MNKERNLLPWVLGALFATAVAIAITAVSSNKTAPPVRPALVVASQPTTVPVTQAPPPPPAASAPPVAASAPAVVAALAQEPDPTAPSSAAQTQATPETPASSGQIWECTTKGVKTFSNNPCGENSTLREVGPINTMNPTPAVHYARAYSPEPRYAPAYADPDGAADQEPYSDSVSGEFGGNSYAIIRGVGFVARRRPEHPHHRPMPNHRNIGPTPRKY